MSCAPAGAAGPGAAGRADPAAPPGAALPVPAVPRGGEERGAPGCRPGRLLQQRCHCPFNSGYENKNRGGGKKPKHEDTEMPPAESEERTSAVMALLELDRAGLQEIKSCRACIYCGGNKLQDEIQALRDLFSASWLVKESTEMTLRILKLALCGGRLQ